MNVLTVNFKNSEDLYKNSINIKSNESKNGANEIGNIFEDSRITSSENMIGKKVNSKSYESIMEDVSSVTEEIKNSAATAKDSLKALFNKMSGADCVRMEEDGYSLNDLDAEEMVTVVDRIKIMLATYCEDYQSTSGDLDLSKIKEVVGTTAMSNQVISKLKEVNLPDTKDNIDQIKNIAAQAEEIRPLSEEAKNYLVANKLAPSIENIYKAEYSSMRNSSISAKYQSGQIKISDEEWKQLKPQVEVIISQSGLEVNEQNMKNAKSFIENNIPVTEKNLVYKNELDNLDLTNMDRDASKEKTLNKIAENMTLGNSARSTLLIESKSILQMVSQAIRTIHLGDVNETIHLTNQGIHFTIKNLREVQSSQGQGIETEGIETKGIENQEIDSKGITNYRQLEEIRILMTAQAGLSLAKQGFNLDTTPIADLVEQLKVIEAQMYGDVSGSVLEVKKAIYEIRTSPDVMIGAVMSDRANFKSMRLVDFSQMGSDLKQKFKEASQTYEAVGTEVRSDLGDSIGKAIASSTESILVELKLEDTKSNRDAVRILGYNGMEMTDKNISSVKEIYSTLNNLIENMKPETVLSMIRDDISPMNTDITDLNDYLIEQNETLDSIDKFSKFLYKLDRTDGITQEEREQFIGIFKMMNIFKKDAGKAVGSLIKQDIEITMSNLMQAYKSSKVSGIDRTIDDKTGVAEVIGKVNYFNNLFSETSQRITPKSLKTVQEEQLIETRSVENFCEKINEVYDSQLESEYYDKYLKDMNQISDIENSMLRELTENGQQVSINNIIAMQNIMSPNYFQKYYNLTKENNSLMSTEILETFIEKLGSESEIGEAYESLASKVNQATTEMLNSSAPSKYSDVETLRMMGKEIGLLKNLSQKHDYKIPFVIDKEVRTINLQIVEDSNNKGRISIRFSSKALGNVCVECKLSTEIANVYAITDGDESLLKERIENLTDNITKDFGVEKCSIFVNKSNQIPDVNYKTDGQEISMKKLYGFAKSIVIGLI